MRIDSAMLQSITPSPGLSLNSQETYNAIGAVMEKVPTQWHEGRERGSVLCSYAL